MISKRFHVNDKEGNVCIGYEMIMVCKLMVQLGLVADYKHKAIEWDNTVVNIKYPGNLIGKPKLTKHNIQSVVI